MKSLLGRVVVNLAVIILIPGVLFTLAAEWLRERVRIDHLPQRAVDVARHIVDELCHSYLDKEYDREGLSFEPLTPEHLDERDELIVTNMHSLRLERVNSLI